MTLSILALTKSITSAAKSLIPKKLLSHAHFKATTAAITAAITAIIGNIVVWINAITVPTVIPAAENAVNTVIKELTNVNKVPPIVSNTPKPSVINPTAITTFLILGSKFANLLAKLATNSIPSLNTGNNALPLSIASTLIWFFIIANCDAVVPYLCEASLVKALFSFHALLPMSKALLNTSLALLALFRASVSLISLIPISDSIAVVDFPSLSVSPNPSINAIIAPVASASNAFLNSLVDIPATFAKSFKESLLVSTANCILDITLENADPPASASIPTELKAPAKDNICASLNPIWAPAPANLIAIAVISLSVVAKLLPSATTVLPNLSKSFWLIPTIFANLAKDVAASSLAKLVASPSIAIVSVNLSILSVSMPNWPALSAMDDNSLALCGIVVDNCFNPFSKSAKDVLVLSSTVFLTPAKALSNSIALLIAPINAPPTLAVIAAPATIAPFPTVWSPLWYSSSFFLDLPVAVLSFSISPLIPFKGLVISSLNFITACNTLSCAISYYLLSFRSLFSLFIWSIS